MIFLAIQKAKSENKFYAAMREKDALVAESKNMARVIEKQSKLVEKLTNSEKELNKEIVSDTYHSECICTTDLL